MTFPRMGHALNQVAFRDYEMGGYKPSHAPINGRTSRSDTDRHERR